MYSKVEIGEDLENLRHSLLNSLEELAKLQKERTAEKEERQKAKPKRRLASVYNYYQNHLKD